MSKEIRAKIDELNAQLEQVVAPGIFTLNPEAVKISKEIESLQSKCQHHFVEGQCEFCHLEGIDE